MRQINLIFMLAAISAYWGVASPARAIDCTKASSDVEKAICADKSLVATDAALNSAYAAFRARLGSGDPVRLLGQSQKDWLADREIECNVVQNNHPTVSATCLAADMEKRRRFLTGLPETGPGAASPLWPWFRWEKGYELAFNTGFAFDPPASAAETSVNSAINALLAKSAAGPKNFFTFRYVYGSPRFVSLHVEGEWDGGAHPMPWRGDINFDMTQARLLTMADAFSASALTTLTNDCRGQVSKDMQTTNKSIAAERDKNLVRIVGDLGRWSFLTDGAVVGFDHGEINDYTEGDHECRFPASHINDLSKPDFPKFN